MLNLFHVVSYTWSTLLGCVDLKSSCELHILSVYSTIHLTRLTSCSLVLSNLLVSILGSESTQAYILVSSYIKTYLRLQYSSEELISITFLGLPLLLIESLWVLVASLVARVSTSDLLSPF